MVYIADVQTSDMLKLPIPKLRDDKYTLVSTNPSDVGRALLTLYNLHT